jgi:hypothetical protein
MEEKRYTVKNYYNEIKEKNILAYERLEKLLQRETTHKENVVNIINCYRYVLLNGGAIYNDSTIEKETELGEIHIYAIWHDRDDYPGYPAILKNPLNYNKAEEAVRYVFPQTDFEYSETGYAFDVLLKDCFITDVIRRFLEISSETLEEIEEGLEVETEYVIENKDYIMVKSLSGEVFVLYKDWLCI